MRRGKLRKPAALLAPRLRQIAALAARGLLDKEIAYELGLAPGTVKVCLHFVYERLNIKTGNQRVKLAIYWLEHGDLRLNNYE